MSALVLELPASLQAEVSGQAARRGLSESAWLEEAVREKLVAEAELTCCGAKVNWTGLTVSCDDGLVPRPERGTS